VHGIALAPDLNRGFISCERPYLERSLTQNPSPVLASVATGDGPDAICMSRTPQRVFAFNGRGRAPQVSMLRPTRSRQPLRSPANQEFAGADGRGACLCNIEDTVSWNDDARSAVLKIRWPLPKCEDRAAWRWMLRSASSHCANQILAVYKVNGQSVRSVAIGRA